MHTITNVRVLTGVTFSEPSDVTFDGPTITEVTTTTSQSRTDSTDGTDRYLVPGLIDTHVHLSGRSELDAMAKSGVTTAIDLGTHPASLVDTLRAQPGLTDVYSAGSAASAPGSTQSTVMGFPEDSVVASPDDAKRFVAVRVSENADLIKIIVEDPTVFPAALSLESIAAIVQVAHWQNLLTVAHATTPYAFRLAVEAGVDIVTHVPMDGALEEDVLDLMQARGTVASPTLTMMRTVALAGQAPRDALGAEGSTGSDPDLGYRRVENAVNAVRQLHHRAIPIVAGTDANPFVGMSIHVAHGTSLHDELGLLVQAGLSPSEALHGATVVAAQAFRLHDRGVICPGQRADLVLVDTDPLTDLGALRTPHSVWIAGAPVNLR